jgi:hypothetical protein
VRYTYNLATSAIIADQEALIDKLLEQYENAATYTCSQQV